MTYHANSYIFLIQGASTCSLKCSGITHAAFFSDILNAVFVMNILNDIKETRMGQVVKSTRLSIAHYNMLLQLLCFKLFLCCRQHFVADCKK